jgi:putative oxidoreductase
MATIAVYRRHEPPVFARPSRRGERAALVAARAVFGGYFLYSGWKHWKNRQMMSSYAASKGVPAAELAVVGSGAMVALGGLSLLLGVRPKMGAALIAGFLAGVTPTMHAFWKDENPQEKMNNEVHFMKNLALLGGASLAAAVPEPWPLSAGNHQGRLGV